MSAASMPSGFEELEVRPGASLGPDVGELAWHDFELAHLVRRSVSFVSAAEPGPRSLGARPGDYIVHRTWEWLPRCECGFVPSAADCPRHRVLEWNEFEAARALYESPIEVGREGIGGFTAGQAEETILALRVAGHRLAR